LGYFEEGQPLTYGFNLLNKGIIIFNISGTPQVNAQTLHQREGIGS